LRNILPIDGKRLGVDDGVRKRERKHAMNSLTLPPTISELRSSYLTRPSIAAATAKSAATASAATSAAESATTTSSKSTAASAPAGAGRKCTAALCGPRGAKLPTHAAWATRSELPHIRTGIRLSVLRHAGAEAALYEERIVTGFAGTRCEALRLIAAEGGLQLLVEVLVARTSPSGSTTLARGS
jgi:hypothetical protein